MPNILDRKATSSNQQPKDHQSNDVIHIEYRFIFRPDLEKRIEVELDKKTLKLGKADEPSRREWTKLGFFKCPNCPLDEKQHAYCPTAVALVGVVDSFWEMVSYKEVDLFITTEEREYSKHTTLRQSLGSLVGLYMVTSGCPILGKLRPMVRHHLPFASLAETLYRMTSMYLLAQYFLYKRGREPDWELKNLVKISDEIQIVNKSFFQRLAYVTLGDATLNALINLDMFAKHVSDRVSQDVLNEIEESFAEYFE